MFTGSGLPKRAPGLLFLAKMLFFKMKTRLAILSLAALALGSVIASRAVAAEGKILFQDNCEGDFDARYQVYAGGFAYTESPEGGGFALSPTTGGPWNWIGSTNYEGGDFTDTRIKATFRVFNHDLQGQSVTIVLLADGFLADSGDPRKSTVTGYSFTVYPYGNRAVPLIARTNADGTATNLIEGLSRPDPEGEVVLSPDVRPAPRAGYWETWTATVEVKPGSTDLALTWEGQDGITHSWEVSDDSPERLTTGTGFALRAYPGDTATGVSIDDITIEKLP